MDSIPPFDPKTVDEELLKMLDYLKVFENNGQLIQHPLLDYIDQANTNFKGLNELNKNPNLMVLWHRLKYVERYEPEWKYKNAFINQERIKCILFQYNPWFRSRLGHEAWWYINYANPNSYYIMTWEDHFDPRLWYKPGEKIRQGSGVTGITLSDPKGESSSATC